MRWWMRSGIAAILLGGVPAHALECPKRISFTGPGVLRETPAQTQQLAKLLGSGDDDNRIEVITDDLRERYPGIQSTEIVNYLMTAYCPVVARLSGLGEAEKQARMDRFVGQVVRIVY